MKFGGALFMLLIVAGIGYVCWHIYRVIPLGGVWKTAAVVAFLLWFVSCFLYIFVGLDRLPMSIAIPLYRVASSWAFVLLYLFIIFAVLDVCSLCHIIPKGALKDSVALSIGIPLALAAVFSLSRLHYEKKTRVMESISTQKPLSKPLRIVLLSDLHFGYNIREREALSWVRKINAEHPDLVLVGGDIIDGSVRPLYEWGAAEILRSIEAPVYACLGNHEYITGIDKSVKFYSDAGVHLLRDDSAIPIEGLRVIGRDDRTNRSRASLADIVSQGPDSLFTILLDHEPYNLEQAQECGVDFQFSGHTHYGQVWPISWIERLMYEQAFGPLTKGNTRYYVSSGMGIWGPRWRVGTRSEYLVLEITPSGNRP